MRLANIREAPLIRANYLLSQEKNKKGLKSIQPEINKMSEIFGVDFDKGLYKLLFEEIDFKDVKNLLNTKNAKTLYFLQEFSSLLSKPNFISIFSEILRNTENTNLVNEIMDGLNKLIKLTFDNQIKLLISFIYSGNEKYVNDAKNILLNKCKEIEKDNKTDQLSLNTIQNLLLVIDTFEEVKQGKIKINFLNFIQSNNYQNGDKLKQLSDLEKLLDVTIEEPIEIEKVFSDIGPYMINNMFNCPNNELLSYKLDEKRLANFIIFMLKHPNMNEDKEIRYLNKIFLMSLNDESAKNIVENSDKQVLNWNIDNFYKIFKSSIDNMESTEIFNNFDVPTFSIKDKKKFEFFFQILQKLNIINNNKLDIFFNFIFNKWDNELNQIEFLQFLVNYSNPEIFSFTKYNGKRVQKNFDLNPTISKNSNNYLIEPWTCINLIQVLLKLSNGNYYVKVKDMFNWPIQNIPELIALSLIQIKPQAEDFLYDELIQEVLTSFLGNHMNSFAVIEEVWNSNKDLVIRTISNMYNSSPDLMNLSRILDISQKLKDSLLLLVNCNDYKFAVNLAILAVKRDFLHIEQWLKDRIEKVGDEFVEALLTYIKDNLIAHCKSNTTATKENVLEKSQLSLESLAVIFENLVNAKHSKNPKISLNTEEEIKIVYKNIFEIFDELQVQPMDSKVIEDTANSIFQSMFKGDTTVYETIEKLKEYKDSNDQKEREIYACMIHCLLDEYRFYHQYPEKQLNTISTLFGQIINHKLIEGVIETIALKYILEGIKKGNGPMFTFGTTALQQFIDKLPSLPTYLKSLVETPQLKGKLKLYEQVLEKYNSDYISGNTSINSTNNLNDLNSDFQNQNIQINNNNNQSNISTNSNSNNTMKTKVFNVNYEDPKNQMKKGKEFISMNPPINQMGNINPNITNKNEVQPFFFPNNMQNIQGMQNPMIQNMNQININQVPSNNQNINPNISGSTNNLIQGLQGNPEVFNSNNGNSLLNNRQKQTKLSRPSQPQSSNNLNEMFSENERIQSPNEDIIGKMKMIFNSMTKNNVAEKANELKLLLSNDNIIRWFSNFFIANRISSEYNNHQKYNDIIIYINNKELNNYLIRDTINCIHQLLSRDIGDKEQKEKLVLRNLGSWLGLMTLARNKPILARDLDLKEIIYDAYENGKLRTIIPFISKILEHCAKTKVFHPKNPWLQGILALFSELLVKPNLYNNLKFEIESLFKKLNINFSDIPQTKFLEKLTLPSYSNDFPKQQNIIQETQIDQINLNELYNKIVQLTNYVSEIFSLIKIRGVAQIINQQELVKILTQSLSSSISEIISPVVERAVNISLVTTKELVIKDLMFEMDEKKFQIAASNCIKSLAGSLALITCKEPLRIGYNQQLKDALSKKKLEQEFIEIITSQPNNDLLDIGCAYIHNYVIQKAIEKIQNDEAIIKEIDRRRKGISYDIESEYVIKADLLPDILKPKITGLTPEQFKIYENFDTIYESYTKNEPTQKMTWINVIGGLLKEVLENVDPNNINKTLKNYNVCMLNMQNISHSQTNIEEGNKELQYIEKCVSESKIENVDLIKGFAEISFKFAFHSFEKKNNKLFNLYIALIKGWVSSENQISREITNLLMKNYDISMRFNLELHLKFIKNNVINMSDYEMYLYSYLQSPITRDLCIDLLNELRNAGIYNNNFQKILPFMLDKDLARQYFTLFDKKNSLPSDLNIKRESIIDYKICNIKDVKTYKIFSNMCTFAFNQIVDIIYPFQSFKLEKLQQKLKNFLESPFIKNEEQMNVFIMIITEQCIKRGTEDNSSSNYNPENGAKSIYALLNAIPRTMNKSKMFSNILLGIFKTLYHDYVKSNLSFNQRPYYKLFFNFIFLLDKHKNNDLIFNSDYKKIQYMTILAEFFRILSPLNYPGFALAWLDLISCKYFISTFLDSVPQSKTKDIHIYEKYLYLIIDLFNYLKMSSNELITNFASKVFLDHLFKFVYLLCDSFPEFVSNYYYIIIVSLPTGSNFIQLKNLILSCGPRDIEKPDPLSDDFTYPEKKKNASILFDIASILQDYGYKVLIDNYIETKKEEVISELCKKLNETKNKNFNFYVINAIVIYWAQKILKQLQEKKIKNGEIFEFFTKMIKLLALDNRDHLINSILNELRYPSNQTIFFSCLLVYICNDIGELNIEEHIITNILERLMFKPVPWGVLVTFSQLFRNQKYKLLERPFVTKNNLNEKLILKLRNFLKNDKKTANFIEYQNL